MEGSAHINSIDVLRELHAGLAIFRSDASAALVELETQLARTIHWLQHDQTAHWQREIRKRQELLTRAKSDMYRKQVSQEQPRAGVDQKKAVEAAKRRLEEAEQKLEAVRRWSRTLDKEAILYRGECQSFSGVLEVETPAMMARLERMADALAAYASLAAQDPSAITDPASIVQELQAEPAPGFQQVGAAAQDPLVDPVSEQDQGGPDGHERRARDASGSDQEPESPLGPGPRTMG